MKRLEFEPWVGKSPWRRAWRPTPVSLPGESHGQRSLEGYSPWGCKGPDTTEVRAHTCTQLAFLQFGLKRKKEPRRSAE